MASSVQEQLDVEATLPEEPTALLAQATGMQIAVLQGECSKFAPACLHTCLHEDEHGHIEGGCAVLRALLEGASEETIREAHVCDRGHALFVRSTEDGSGQTVMLLRPSEQNPPRAEQVRAFTLQAAAAFKLWQQLHRLTAESQGLAMELINSYEQLNVIFDIARQVSELEDVEQIKTLLIRILCDTLSGDWACYLGQDASQWWCADEHTDRNATLDWVRESLAAKIQETKADRQIHVINSDPDRENAPLFGTMTGAIGSSEEEAEVVVVGRRSGHEEFKSGDMQMMDSVLNYGSQVISNQRLIARVKKLSLEAVLALVSAIDKKDAYTSGHSERVGVLSRLVGEELGLSGSDLQDLEWAGILHDVGKIGISDAILTKQSGLSDEEFSLIQSHPRMSYEVIEPLATFGQVREAVLHHHETPDGKGYPDGLKGDEIPLAARIVHVTDSFDALTSHRSYRRGFPIAKALVIMHEDAPEKIDPDVLEAFERTLEKFRTKEPGRFLALFGHIEELSA